MDDRVWVGPASRCPEGWLSVAFVDDLVAAAGNPAWVVIDDAPGGLREADFLRLFSHLPLTRIARVVGPWRAGVGRTDPQWPLATLHRDGEFPESEFSPTAAWPPLTAGYEDLAGVDVIPDLTRMSFQIEIGDHELRTMWADWISHAGGRLSCDRQVDVLIHDESVRLSHAGKTAPSYVVVLSSAPWNTQALPTGLAVDQRGHVRDRTLVVSVLDSPARVTQRLLAVWPRAAS